MNSLFERFTWELRAKLLGAQQAAAPARQRPEPPWGRGRSGPTGASTSFPHHSCAQNADHLAHNTPFSAFFTKVVCDLGATPPQVAASPSPIRGIARHEPPTRRRHAARRCRVVQNPHDRRCGGHRRIRRVAGLAAVPVGGGGAWPGFEATRRAKLAARTASGRAGLAPHGRSGGVRRTEVWRLGASRTASGRAAAHRRIEQTQTTGRAGRDRLLLGPVLLSSHPQLVLL